MLPAAVGVAAVEETETMPMGIRVAVCETPFVFSFPEFCLQTKCWFSERSTIEATCDLSTTKPHSTGSCALFVQSSMSLSEMCGMCRPASISHGWTGADASWFCSWPLLHLCKELYLV